MTITEPLPRPDVASSPEVIAQRQQEKLLRLKDDITQNKELRVVIAEVAAIRRGCKDPNVEAIDDTLVYSDDAKFEDVHAMMRWALDFRSNPDGTYGERWQAEGRAEQYLQPGMTAELKEKIEALAKYFGLLGDTEPENPHADMGLILGGGGVAAFDRTRYIKELTDEGALVTDTIVALGSERKVDDTERELAAEYIDGDEETEFDLMVTAIEKTYGIKIEEKDILSWVDHTISYDVPRLHRVVCIPATDVHPNIFIVSSGATTNPFVDVLREGKLAQILRYRANTPDNLDVLDKLAQFEEGARVVAVTNQHFVPFQGAVAAGILGTKGVDAEVVGFDPSHYGRPDKEAYQLLQELLTTADSVARATAAA